MAKATKGAVKAVEDGRELVEAVAYLRTSSATNAGDDKDSAPRQRRAIAAYAASAGYQLVEEFNDAAVSGADRIEDRPGFGALLDRIEGNGVRVVIVEDVSRFARDVQAHILGVALLRQREVKLLTSTGADLTDGSDEMQEGMLRIMAIFAEIEKKRLVKKLASARERKRAASPDGKCGGRKSIGEMYPEAAALARRLYKKKRKDRPQPSLHDVAVKLAKRGWHREGGEPFYPMTVKRLVDYRPATTRAESKTSPMAK